MQLTRLRYGAMCAIVAALAFAAPGGRACAQGQGSPAELAEVLWRQGYVLHILGAYEQAVALFERSIELHPTAEGHTFLGWSLSHLGRTEEAIAECKKAIAVDPDFGNPYNDIGVYLVELGRSDEAVTWLEKAMRAKRYCCYQFPHEPDMQISRIRLSDKTSRLHPRPVVPLQSRPDSSAAGQRGRGQAPVRAGARIRSRLSARQDGPRRNPQELAID
jgi:Tetratricopeptide repeat